MKNKNIPHPKKAYFGFTRPALLVFVAALTLTSCELPFGENDEPTPGPEFIYVDDDFWSYVGLPENSYWIYQNIHTGEIDSSYTVGNIRYELRDPSMGRYRLRYWFEYRLSALHLRNKDFETKWYVSKAERGPEQKIQKDNYFKMKCTETGNSITMAFKDSVKHWPENDIWEQIEVDWHDTVSFAGREYREAVRIQTGDTWENSAFIYNAYYVKDIGAVYRQFSDGSEWALIRYRIGEQSPREYTYEW